MVDALALIHPTLLTSPILFTHYHQFITIIGSSGCLILIGLPLHVSRKLSSTQTRDGHPHARNGAELRYIQAMLGHSNVNTTQIYIHVSIRKLQEVHKRTHPSDYKMA